MSFEGLLMSAAGLRDTPLRLSNDWCGGWLDRKDVRWVVVICVTRQLHMRACLASGAVAAGSGDAAVRI